MSSPSRIRRTKPKSDPSIASAATTRNKNRGRNRDRQSAEPEFAGGHEIDSHHATEHRCARRLRQKRETAADPDQYPSGAELGFDNSRSANSAPVAASINDWNVREL